MIRRSAKCASMLPIGSLAMVTPPWSPLFFIFDAIALWKNPKLLDKVARADYYSLQALAKKNSQLTLIIAHQLAKNGVKVP
jgi:hypothetical protein